LRQDKLDEPHTDDDEDDKIKDEASKSAAHARDEVPPEYFGWPGVIDGPCFIRPILGRDIEDFGILGVWHIIPWYHTVFVNMKAPDFTLPDEDGTMHSLSQYRGKWLILYFYPKDDTPGCTKEACFFRDQYDDLRKMGTEVVGISKDPVRQHRKFKDKYGLNFTLLSDESRETIKAYGAWGQKKFMGRIFDGTLRNTYLIDPSGEIRKSYEKMNPADNAGGIMKDLVELK
jgi:thioredoxin-dependent peroxiredoxin